MADADALGDDHATFIKAEGMPTLSRAAFLMHTSGGINSIQDGRPGFVSDEYLNAIAAETTTTVLELEAAGMWARREGGYLIVADDVLKIAIKATRVVCTHVPGHSGCPRANVGRRVRGSSGPLGRQRRRARHPGRWNPAHPATAGQPGSTRPGKSPASQHLRPAHQRYEGSVSVVSALPAGVLPGLVQVIVA